MTLRDFALSIAASLLATILFELGRRAYKSGLLKKSISGRFLGFKKEGLTRVTSTLFKKIYRWHVLARVRQHQTVIKEDAYLQYTEDILLKKIRSVPVGTVKSFLQLFASKKIVKAPGVADTYRISNDVIQTATKYGLIKDGSIRDIQPIKLTNLGRLILYSNYDSLSH